MRTSTYFVSTLLAMALCSLLASNAAAAELSIEIGSPAAAQSKTKTLAILSVRLLGCDDPTKFRVDGNAIQIVGDAHASVPLVPLPGSSAGVYAVGSSARPNGAPWLMVLSADCQGAKAGALIPIDARGVYNRDAAKFLNHAPSKLEIDTALKTLVRDTTKGESK